MMMITMNETTEAEVTERRTRRWPVSMRAMTFAEADKLEAELRAQGHETARVCWGGQWLEVRARAVRS